MNSSHKWPFETPICKLSVLQCSYLQSHSPWCKEKKKRDMLNWALIFFYNQIGKYLGENK
jgi:hypothetical protein